MRRIFDGVGRPSATETAARTRDLIAQLAAGKTLLDAARTAGVKPDRVLRLLEEPEFFAAFSAFRQEYAA